MVSRLGEKVGLHLVLLYIFFHKQKARSGKGEAAFSKLRSYRSQRRWESWGLTSSLAAFIHDHAGETEGDDPSF